MDGILEFQCSFRIAFQRCEVHNERTFNGKHRVVLQILVFPVEDLSRDWLVSLALHL